MRNEKELESCIKFIEELYPIEKPVGSDPIGNYVLGILAGLKCALGVYPSFVEMDIQDFMRNTFQENNIND